MKVRAVVLTDQPESIGSSVAQANVVRFAGQALGMKLLFNFDTRVVMGQIVASGVENGQWWMEAEVEPVWASLTAGPLYAAASYIVGGKNREEGEESDLFSVALVTRPADRCVSPVRWQRDGP